MRPTSSSKRPGARPRRHRPVIPDCKHFTGYKPCFPSTRCYERCVDCDPIGTKILIINLDAMGNVLVTTSILPPLKRRYPISHISWITLRSTCPLLSNNRLLDRVFAWEPESWMILQEMGFDVILNVDKSQRSCAFMMSLHAKKKLGFGLNKNGVIVPLNKEAYDNYILGLDDHLKFKVNRKTVPQILCEQFGLPYRRDDYMLSLTAQEEVFCTEYKKRNGLLAEGGADAPVVVGFNTGCSELYANKKMTVEQHVDLIRRLSGIPGLKLVLVGGPEDTLRNAEISRQVGDSVLNTPTTEGIRRGLCYINTCNAVVSGDSFGMHAAIGLKKYVIVWFGVSCASEIDLFGRGVKFVPEGLECSPCWKRECPYGLECIQMIDLDGIAGEVTHLLKARRPSQPATPGHA